MEYSISMKPEYEQLLEKQEQKFIDQIALILKENKGKYLLSLERSSIDMVHAFVKEITTIHHTRGMFMGMDEND